MRSLLQTARVQNQPDSFTRNIKVTCPFIKIDPSSILSIIHTNTVGTMLNFNGGNNGHDFKNVTCK